MADGSVISLRPEPLTRERFAPYGDVIDTSRDTVSAMNEARFERFDDLCTIDMAGCRTPTSLPLRIDLVERHPLGSQAFVPLTPCRMLIVVAPPGEDVDPAELRAFATSGRQGINYHRGTWHMPLIAFDVGQEFLIIDRRADAPNCEQHELDTVVMLEGV